jgi:putative two-component system response regulator
MISEFKKQKATRMKTIDEIDVLIVDDDPSILEILYDFLIKANFQCITADCGEAALAIMDKQRVNVVITDIHMPGINGVDLVRIIKNKYESNVIVMTGYLSNFTYEKMIEAGASDFITKPISMKEIFLRVNRILRERKLLSDHKKAHKKLQEAHNALQESYLDTIHRLVLAAEYKDEDTGNHIVRMSNYCSLIADKLGLPDDQVQNIQSATPMHDIGKVGIPDNIIMKTGKLTHKEFKILKNHTIIGAKILEGSKSEILRIGQQIAISHHEKWDGKGYPYGIAGTQIPLVGRIVALADTFDALTSKRPYKAPYPIEIAIKIILKDRESSFDPDIVDVFMRNINGFEKIQTKTSSTEKTGAVNFEWSERDHEAGLFSESSISA